MNFEHKNHAIELYIDAVCEQIRHKEILPDIRAELQAHFDDLLDEYASSNKPESESIQDAIRQMGDPADVGIRLNKVHKNSVDWFFVFFFVALSTAGIMAQASVLLSGDISILHGEPLTVWLVPEFIGIALGLWLFLKDYRMVRSIGKALYFLTAVLMIITIIVGVHIDGVMYLMLYKYPLDVFGLSPFLLLIGLTSIFTEMDWSRISSIPKTFGYLVVPVVLFHGGNANAHSIEFVIAFFGVMLASQPGIKKLLGITLPTLALGLAVFVFQMTRGPHYIFLKLTGFWHPQNQSQGFGYWYVQAQKAVSSANVWGHGFASSNWRLPGSGLQLTFNYLLYAFGWAGAVIVLTFVLGLLYRITRTLQVSRDRYSTILSTGIVTLFSFKLLYSIVMGFGVIPIIGIHMPLVSPDPGEFAIEMAVVGLLMNIYKMKNRISVSPPSNESGVTPV